MQSRQINFNLGDRTLNQRVAGLTAGGNERVGANSTLRQAVGVRFNASNFGRRYNAHRNLQGRNPFSAAYRASGSHSAMQYDLGQGAQRGIDAAQRGVQSVRTGYRDFRTGLRYGANTSGSLHSLDDGAMPASRMRRLYENDSQKCQHVSTMRRPHENGVQKHKYLSQNASTS